MLCRVLFDLPIEINQNAVFDFIYIEDLCKIIDYFIDNNTGEKFYNIGAENHLDLLTIIEKIKKTSGKNFEVKIKNSRINKEYTCNNSRLRNELKDFEFTNIEVSIAELYNWYLENKENIKKEDLLRD